MNRRSDALPAVAELRWPSSSARCATAIRWAPSASCTVPNGSINVVPGRCQFSLDLRAPTDPQRDALVTDVLASCMRICERRQVRHTLEETMRPPPRPATRLAGPLGARG
jgi:N-carbamoyl-L-amino-acid hydrolase